MLVEIHGVTKSQPSRQRARYADEEDGCDTKLLARRQVELPDSVLRYEDDQDIRDEIDHRGAQRCPPLELGRTGPRQCDCLARHVEKDNDDNVQHGIDEDEAV